MTGRATVPGVRSPETPEERQHAEHSLAVMRARVAEWVPLISSPIIPAPHSSLAADDAAGWETYPPSHLAWNAIIAAVDSLEHFQMSLVPPGRAHDTGHRARSAVTAAAMAVCVLCPPRRADRVAFAMRCAWDDLTAEQRAVRTLRATPAPRPSHPPLPAGLTSSWVAWSTAATTRRYRAGRARA